MQHVDNLCTAFLQARLAAVFTLATPPFDVFGIFAPLPLNPLTNYLLRLRRVMQTVLSVHWLSYTEQTGLSVSLCPSFLAHDSPPHFLPPRAGL